MKRILLIIGLVFGMTSGTRAQDSEAFTLTEVIGRGSIYGIHWLGDGETIAVTNALGVWLYPANDLNAEPRHLSFNGPVTLAFDPVGATMAVAEDGGFGLYNLETGERSHRLPGGHSNYCTLVFSADGKRLAAADTDYSIDPYGESFIHLWSIPSEADGQTEDQPPLQLDLTPDLFPPQMMAFSPDNSKLAVIANFSGGDMSLSQFFMLDLTSGDLLTTADYTGELTNNFTLDDARLVVTGPFDFPALLAFDPQPERFGIEFLTLDQPRLRALTVSPDARLAVTTYDDEIRLEDTFSGEVVMTLPTLFFSQVIFSPDNERIAVISGGRLSVYEIAAFDNNPAPCGESPSACATYTDAHIPQQIATEPDITLDSDEPALSPSGDWEIVSGWEEAEGYHLVNRSDDTAVKLEIDADNPYIRYIRFNLDESLLAVSFTTYLHGGTEDTVVRVWDLRGEKPNPKPIALLPYYTELGTLLFSPDSTLLATTSTNGAVFVWDTTTWEQIAELPHPRRAYQLQFSDDGRTLKTLADDGLLRVWQRG